MVPERFSTARLVAERIAEPHFAELRIMQQDVQMMAMIGGIRDEAASAAYLDRHMTHWREHGFGFWFLRDLATGRSAGIGGLRRLSLDGSDDVELGYGFLPAWWGRGLGTEFARATLGYGFDALAAPSVVALTTGDNHASQRVLRKVGLHFERHVVHDGHPALLFRGYRNGGTT